MQKILLILIPALILSFGFGFFLGNALLPQKIKTETKIWRPEDPMINNVFAQVQGKIKEIKDSEITIEDQGQTFTFSLTPAPKVFIIRTPEPGKTSLPQEGSISDLEVGKEISVSLKVFPDGSFESQIISILVK